MKGYQTLKFSESKQMQENAIISVNCKGKFIPILVISVLIANIVFAVLYISKSMNKEETKKIIENKEVENVNEKITNYEKTLREISEKDRRIQIN